MKFYSIDNSQTVELKVILSSNADDEDWKKEIQISADVNSKDNSACFELLAYLESGPQDEVSHFIEQLKTLSVSHKGKAHIKLAGAEQKDYNDRVIEIYVFSVDSVGHLAIQIELSGTNRYSNNVELPFKTITSFEIDPVNLEGVMGELQALHKGINNNT